MVDRSATESMFTSPPLTLRKFGLPRSSLASRWAIYTHQENEGQIVENRTFVHLVLLHWRQVFCFAVFHDLRHQGSHLCFGYSMSVISIALL